MKRLISVVLAILMCASLIGCGKEDKVKKKDKDGNTITDTGKVITKNGVTLISEADLYPKDEKIDESKPRNLKKEKGRNFFTCGLHLNKQASKDKRVSYINEKLEVAFTLPESIEVGHEFSENGLALVQGPVGDYPAMYGYINTKGEIAIDIKFLKATDFSEGFAAVSLDGNLYGYINAKEEPLTEVKYEEPDDFRNGFCRAGAIVDTRSAYVIINAKGEEIMAPQYDYFDNFQGNYPFENSNHIYTKIRRTETYDVINKEGKIVLKNVKEYIAPHFFSWGSTAELLDGTTVVLNSDGQVIYSSKDSHDKVHGFVNGICRLIIKEESKDGTEKLSTRYINKNGKILFTVATGNSTDFTPDGHAIYLGDDKCFRLIDRTGKELKKLTNIEYSSDECFTLVDGLNLFGLHNKSSRFIDYIHKLVDTKGNITLEGNCTHIDNTNLFLYKPDSKVTVTNYKGDKIVTPAGDEHLNSPVKYDSVIQAGDFIYFKTENGSYNPSFARLYTFEGKDLIAGLKGTVPVNNVVIFDDGYIFAIGMLEDKTIVRMLLDLKGKRLNYTEVD